MSISKRSEINQVERELLEAGFELAELESEKQVKTSDARMLKILKELKTRCRGYYGQFYELVRPINKKYDIAVKVALSKCLKFLVVDSMESSKIVNEFLKEKQITREVLILDNVPDKPISGALSSKLEGLDASLVYDVIEMVRQDSKLEKAVKCFTASKVVARSFDLAADLQRRKQVKDIVTEDGTEFRSGMISGGNH